MTSQLRCPGNEKRGKLPHEASVVNYCQDLNA